MKFTVNRNVLFQALSQVGKAITGSTIPITDNYRIGVVGNFCSITGTNMEVFFRQQIEVKSEIELLDICLNAPLLRDFVKTLADQPIDFTVSEKESKGVKSFVVKISCAEAECSFSAESGDLYPKFPDFGELNYDIPGHVFIDGVTRVSSCIDDSTATILSDLVIKTGNGIIVAGLSHSISSIMKVFDNTINRESLFISKASTNVLKNYPATEQIKFSVSPTTLILENTDGFRASFRRIDHAEPNFEPLFQMEKTSTFIVDADRFRQSLRRAKLFAPKLDNTVKLSSGKDLVSLNAINESGGEFNEHLHAESDTEVSAYFRYEQLMSAAEKVKTFAAKISFVQFPKGKAIFVEEENDGQESDIKTLVTAFFE